MGRHAYLAGLKSPLLRVTTRRLTKSSARSPVSNFIRPCTINGRQTLCYVNVNELLGFRSWRFEDGQNAHRVEIAGFEKGR